MTGAGIAPHRDQHPARLARRGGAPCEWCGRPLYLDRKRNWDYEPERNALSGTLHGDHSKMSRARRYRLGRPIPLPDRLPHQTCNIQRGDGGNDHLAAAGNGRRADQGIDTTKLSMPWPW